MCVYMRLSPVLAGVAVYYQYTVVGQPTWRAATLPSAGTL
jgi:hypothetical protein